MPAPVAAPSSNPSQIGSERRPPVGFVEGSVGCDSGSTAAVENRDGCAIAGADVCNRTMHAAALTRVIRHLLMSTE
jgi:hypothetical protein